MWKRERPDEAKTYKKLNILSIILTALTIIFIISCIITYFIWTDRNEIDRIIYYTDTKDTILALIIISACLLALCLYSYSLKDDYIKAKTENYIQDINLDYTQILIRGYNSRITTKEFEETKRYAFYQSKNKLKRRSVFDVTDILIIVLCIGVSALAGYAGYDYLLTEMENWLLSAENEPFIFKYDIYIAIALIVIMVAIIVIAIITNKRKATEIDDWIKSLM